MTSLASARSSWTRRARSASGCACSRRPGTAGKGTDLWEGILTPGLNRQLVVCHRSLARPLRHLAPQRRGQGGSGHRRRADARRGRLHCCPRLPKSPSRGSADRRTLRTAAVCTVRHVAVRRGATGGGLQRGRGRRRWPRADPRAGHCLRSLSRCWSSGTSPAAAAWYEFFPRSEGAVRNHSTGEWTSGNFRTAAKRLDAVAGHGIRRHLHAAHPPDRRAAPQGPEQHPDRRSARSRFTLGHRLEGRRPRRHPPGPRDLRGLRRLRGAGQRTRPRSGTRPCAAGGAGPPLGADQPGMVHHPGGRQHRLRGEPAEEVPGHLPPQLRQRSRGPVQGNPAHRPALGQPRSEDLPRGQSAHQARVVLGMAHRARSTRRTQRSCSSPRPSPGPP